MRFLRGSNSLTPRATALALFLASAISAAEVPREFSRLDLTDGRKLKNVVVKTYNPADDRLLILADGKAMTIPRTLIPEPFASHLKSVSRSGETVSITGSRAPLATAAQQYTLARPVSVPSQSHTPPAHSSPVAAPTRPPPLIYPSAAPASSHAQPLTPNQAVAAQAGIDLEAHKNAARERARRYYRFEFRAGSDAIAVTGLELELAAPKVVTGWEGRCIIEGKAYLETYDSRGRSFQRRTSTFEVVTEKKADDDEITVLSFTPKS